MAQIVEAPYLFELSGEHAELPRAEVVSCLLAETGSAELVMDGPGYLVARLREDQVRAVCARLALTHTAGRFLGECRLEGLDRMLAGLDLPDGTISVRVKRFQGVGSPGLSGELTSRIGDELSKGRKVDLTGADVRVKGLLSDRLLLYLGEISVDRRQFETRHVRERPFFSPISLHPRYARALVNLTQVKRGQTLLDPFCGTGGIMMEAATIGVRVLGSDASAEMIDGCRRNLAHLGISWERLETADIGEIGETFGQVDAVATDPPYGRSATTMKEPVRELHARAFDSIAAVLRERAAAGVVLPWPCEGHVRLELESSFKQRVHRSLTRHYCVLRRR